MWAIASLCDSINSIIQQKNQIKIKKNYFDLEVIKKQLGFEKWFIFYAANSDNLINRIGFRSNKK